MYKFFVSVVLALALTITLYAAWSTQAHAQFGWWSNPENFACRLVCYNPAICTPGTTVWQTFAFFGQQCIDAAAPNAPAVFGVLALTHGGVHIANCQSYACF